MEPTDAEYGAAWRILFEKRHTELAEARRELDAAVSSTYKGLELREERIAVAKRTLNRISDDIIILGLVKEWAQASILVKKE